MDRNLSTNPPRLVIVVPRFWPQLGDVELFAANLAAELSLLGAKPIVLTAKWAPEWPASIVVSEVAVVRVPHAPRGGWNTFRYMTDLSRWLRRSQSSFDAAYVLGMRHEAYAAIGALAKSRVPVAVRCHDSGPGGDCTWQETVRFGDRIRRSCQSAAAIISSGPSASRELSQCGYDEKRIHVIPSGSQVAESRSAERRFRARAGLAEANHDLAAVEYAPVVLWVGRLLEVVPLLPLLQAWRDVAAKWPSARLWLVGDGPARDPLYAQLVDWEIQRQVLMPGTFDDLSDVMLAADIFVSPQPNGHQQTIVEAMAAGLPVVVADEADVRMFVEPGHSGLVVPCNDRSAWIAALTHLCDNPAAAMEMGRRANQIVEQKFSRRQMALQHIALFEQLVANKSP